MDSVGMSFVRRESTWLILIIVAGLVLRFAAIIAFNHAPESDEIAYRSMALSLTRGDGIIDADGNYAFFNVGYALFILAPVFAIFGDDLFIARALNALLSGLTIFLCYAVAKEAGAGKTGRLLAASLWALYLAASVYTVYLFKENLLTPIILGVIWCALRLTKEPAYLTAVACGVLFGLIALTGNAALSLAVPVVLALILTPTDLRRKFSLSALVLVSAIVVTAPWVVRNTQVLGAPVLNTNGGFNLYLGNNPAATGMFVSIADTPRGSTWQELRNTGEVVASDTLRREAIVWIKENPSAFITLAVKKAALFWTPPFHDGEGPSSKAESAARIIWAIQFLALMAGAIATCFVRNFRTRRVVVIWLAIASYTAVHMLFYVIFRYREPIMPLVCVLAAIMFEYLWNERGFMLHRGVANE